MMATVMANAAPKQCLVRSNGTLHWKYPPRQSTGVEAILQSSTNLTEWSDMQALPYTVDEEFDIPLDADGHQRFYRILFR